MKEKVLEAFSELGFNLEKRESYYMFPYGEMTFMYIPEEDDPNFLGIYAPLPCEYGEDDLPLLHEKIDEINSSRKYMKVFMGQKTLFFAAEQMIFESENLQGEISKMVVLLAETVDIFILSMEQLLDVVKNEETDRK